MEYTGTLAASIAPVQNRIFWRWSLALSLFGLFLLPEESNATTIKCWKNKQNIRECGQIVPQEYSQQRIEIRNERGMVVDVIHAAKSKEQLAEEAKKKKQEKIRKEQDRLLLQTFATERDLLLHREANLNAITGIINISKGKNRGLEKSLNKKRKQAGDYERSGRPVPKALIDEIHSLESQMAKIEKYINERELERAAAIERFDSDLKRFRELKEALNRH